MKQKTNVRYLTQLALLVAIVLLMKVTGLSSVHVGPLNMTFTMVPIAVGAMLMGPLAGGVLGLIYGCTSFYDAVSGGSVMTGTFFQLNPLATFVLCVGMRVLVGVVAGWLFRLLHKVDKTHTVSYFLGGLCTPLLNTIFFMGFIVLVFYNTEYIQNLVATKGASNALSFVVLMVGVQGCIEAVTGAVIGGGIAKGVAAALKLDR
jgi:uncharacterized membrane protein